MIEEIRTKTLNQIQDKAPEAIDSHHARHQSFVLQGTEKIGDREEKRVLLDTAPSSERNKKTKKQKQKTPKPKNSLLCMFRYQNRIEGKSMAALSPDYERLSRPPGNVKAGLLLSRQKASKICTHMPRTIMKHRFK